MRFGGSSSEMDPDSPIVTLAKAGLPGTLATNSELEFARYLRLGDQLHATSALESISERKTTGLGSGYFVTWQTSYFAGQDELVGRQLFRIFKFAPGAPPASAAASASNAPRPAAASAAPAESKGEELPPLAISMTATRIVAGAIASRDFMPVHHDRDYARKQGAPDIFMNILTTNGYVARYVTDWAGSEARLRNIKIRLGGPSTPGTTLRFSGHVSAESKADGERVLEVSLRAVNELGMHASGTVELTLPGSR